MANPTQEQYHELSTAIDSGYWVDWRLKYSQALFSGLIALSLATLVHILWDAAILEMMVPLRRTPYRGMVSDISKLGKSDWYLIGGALGFFMLRKRAPEWAWKAGLLFSSVAITGIAVNVAKIILARPRPEMYLEEGLWGLQWFELESQFLSMPSGHATTLGAVGMVCAIAFPRWGWIGLIAFSLLAIGRVITMHHYASDVIVGVWLGAVGTLLIAQRAMPPKPTKRAQ